MAQQLQPGDLPFEIVCDPQQKLYGELDIRPAKDKMELAGGDALGKIAKVKEEGFQHGAYEGEELQLSRLLCGGREPDHHLCPLWQKMRLTSPPWKNWPSW